MSKILITGSTGFIGSYLVREFIDDNEIICLIRPNTKNLDRIADVKDKITIVSHNIRDSLEPIFDLIKDVDIILNAGANPSAEDSIKNPIESIMDNVVGTATLLEISRKLNLKRFVYFSSAEIFFSVSVLRFSFTIILPNKFTFLRVAFCFL
jgi:UDP-glucose 4-epimerase